MEYTEQYAADLLLDLIDTNEAHLQFRKVCDHIDKIKAEAKAAGFHEGFAEGVAEGRHRDDK